MALRGCFGGQLRALSVSNYLQPIIENRHGTCVASITYPPHANLKLYKAPGEFTQNALAAPGLQDCVFHLEAFTPQNAFQFMAGELATRTPGFYIAPVFLV